MTFYGPFEVSQFRRNVPFVAAILDNFGVACPAAWLLSVPLKDSEKPDETLRGYAYCNEDY